MVVKDVRCPRFHGFRSVRYRPLFTHGLYPVSDRAIPAGWLNYRREPQGLASKTRGSAPDHVRSLIIKLVNVSITSLATCFCRARGIPTVRARVPSMMSVAKPCTIAQQAMEIVSLTAGD